MTSTENSKIDKIIAYNRVCSAAEGICPNAQVCGGCSYQGVSYEDQLKNKLGEVRGCFRAQGLDPQLVSGIEPCAERFYYRNKMEYTFGNRYKDGPMLLGLHMKGSYMSIIDASCCLIVPPDFNIILKATLDFCNERGYTHYHKKFHTGLMRNLVLRWGVRSKEILVNIVTSTESEFEETAFAEMIKGLALQNEVVGIIHTLNDNVSDAVNLDSSKLLYGRNYYNEEIMGLKFKVGMASFFQTNVTAAERLYKDAISLIDNIEGKTVFDLYCGTGTISQAMALKSGKVVGIELVEEAVHTAEMSAKLNGLENCRFIAGDVQKELASVEEKPDVIVVDPPRSGITPKALSGILSYGVRQIVYISCNPKTLAENLRSAVMAGYSIECAKAYDNFPFTKHIETVVLLSRK